MASNREIALIAASSGALSIAGFIFIKNLLCKNNDERLACRGLVSRPQTLVKRNVVTDQEPSKIYEEKSLLDQYLLFNFASNEELVTFDLKENANIYNCSQFPKKVALLCLDHCPDILFSEQSRPLRALDVGCAVGRSCFELAKLFDEVIGIDYSANFINHCNAFLREKTIDYECCLEGNLMQKLTATLDPEVDTSRIQFEVGDACNLREDLGAFDLVLASNLICRLTEPIKFLNRLKTLVKPKGYVILSTPFTWGTEFTPEENWLGGYVDYNGYEVDGLSGLKNHLSESFKLCHQLNMPMLIRETKRKFQLTVCLVTIWQRK